MQKMTFLILVAICLVSCKSIINAPKPAQNSLVAPPVVQPKSTLVLPVKIDLTDYFKDADKQVPMVFDGNQQQCEDVSVQYHFERDPLKLTANSTHFSIGVTGKYRIKLSYCPSCTDMFGGKPSCISPRIPFSCGVGEPMRRMKLEYQTSYKLTEDYGISTTTQLKELKALDPCEVTVFKYDATEHLLKEVEKQLDKLANDIDKMTKKVSFKKEASKFWAMGFESQKIPGYGYLTLQPQSLFVEKPTIKNNVLETKLLLNALPVFSTTKEEIKPTKLPDLKISDKLDQDTVEIIADLKIGYDSLNSIVQKFGGGQSMMIKDNQVIFDSISIAGSANHELQFRIKFSGAKSGIIYVVGTPVFDAANQRIIFEKMDFDLETKSVLLKTAKWLLNDRILKELQKATNQDLKPYFAQMTKGLNKALTYKIDQFKLNGNISKIQVDNIYPEKERLLIRIRLKGNVLLTNDKKNGQ